MSHATRKALSAKEPVHVTLRVADGVPSLAREWLRNALRYVLLNRKHHDTEKKFNKYWIDPFSSAMWFGGWAEKIRIDCGWMHELAEQERPTVDGKSWLLSTGWKQVHGPIRFDDRPS